MGANLQDITRCCGSENEEATKYGPPNTQNPRDMAKQDFWYHHNGQTPYTTLKDAVPPTMQYLKSGVSVDGWSSGMDDDDDDYEDEDEAEGKPKPPKKQTSLYNTLSLRSMKSLDQREEEMRAELENLKSISAALTPKAGPGSAE